MDVVVFEGGVDDAVERDEECCRDYRGCDHEDGCSAGEEGREEAAPAGEEGRYADQQGQAGADERYDVEDEHELADHLIVVQAIFEFFGQDGVDVQTSAVQVPGGDGVEPELSLSWGAVLVGVIPSPSAVVPQIDCVDVF